MCHHAQQDVDMSDVEILAQAEPQIQEFRGQIVVVKYGGHAMENEDLKAKFASDIALLKQVTTPEQGRWRNELSYAFG
jgi:hypothetical protein